MASGRREINSVCDRKQQPHQTGVEAAEGDLKTGMLLLFILNGGSQRRAFWSGPYCSCRPIRICTVFAARNLLCLGFPSPLVLLSLSPSHTLERDHSTPGARVRSSPFSTSAFSGVFTGSAEILFLGVFFHSKLPTLITFQNAFVRNLFVPKLE